MACGTATSWCFSDTWGAMEMKHPSRRSVRLWACPKVVNDCVIGVSQAILKLQKKVIRWPDDEERKQIGSRIKQAHGLSIVLA